MNEQGRVGENAIQSRDAHTSKEVLVILESRSHEHFPNQKFSLQYQIKKADVNEST